MPGLPFILRVHPPQTRACSWEGRGKLSAFGKCTVRVTARTRIHSDTLNEETVIEGPLPEVGQSKGANKGFGGTLRMVRVRSHYLSNAQKEEIGY